MLIDLQPANSTQLSLDIGLTDDLYAEDCTPESRVEQSRLMQTMDAVNLRYGKSTLLLASAGLGGIHRNWSMKQERRTPQYTTRWQDIPIARA